MSNREEPYKGLLPPIDYSPLARAPRPVAPLPTPRSLVPAAAPLDLSRSLEDVHRSVPIPVDGRWLRRMFAFAGPAYMVSVGYMDPGNWATDIEGGARFGYSLIWVLLMSNL